LRAFHDIADHYAVSKRLVADIDYLKEIGGSSLTDDLRLVEEGLPAQKEVPSTYVPFRNAHILAIGVSWAEVLQAESLYIGAVEEDGSGYPDCTDEFFRRFGNAVEAGTKPDTHIVIRTPLIHRSKTAIVRRGVELGAPLHLTWSCYTRTDKACGRCESCQLRLRGFAEAGREDPLSYAER
jgi:7-cyano-7-deazaguanine synthase